MATADHKVRIVINADGSAAISGIRGVSNQLDTFGAKSGGIAGFVKNHWLGIAAAVGAAYLAISKGQEYLRESIALANVQEDAERRIATVIRSTGGAAGYTTEELKKMASEFQNSTVYGDEVILRGQSLLLTFTKIGRDVFPEATEAMMNMSYAMGTDLKQSALQIGKALNDPIKGMTALQRVGVSFTEEQKDMVQRMVETGRTMEAQRFILKELNTEFGGQAAAAAQTYGGRITQLGNAYGDFREELGKAVTENDFMRESAVLVRGAIEDLTGWVKEHKVELRAMVKEAVLFAVDAFLFLIQTVDLVASSYRNMKLSLTATAEAQMMLAGDVSAATAEATKEVLESNKKAEASWGKLTARLEKLREDMGKVKTTASALALATGGGTGVAAEEAAGSVEELAKKEFTLRKDLLKKIREETIKVEQQNFESRLGLFREEQRQKKVASAEEQAAFELRLALKRQEMQQDEESRRRRIEAENEILNLTYQQGELKRRIAVDELASLAGSLGGAEGAAAVGEIAAIATGQDKYTADFDAWMELQDRKIMAMEEYGATEAEIRDAYRQYDLEQERMKEQQKLALASAAAGGLAAIAKTIYDQSQGQNKAAFAAYKTFAIAQAGIDAYKAFNVALSSVPYPFNIAAAAMTLAMGLLKVRQIASMKPGGSVAGGGGGGSSALPSIRAPEAVSAVDEKPVYAPSINITILGNVVDHDAFARDLVPSITKALEDNKR